MFIHMITNVFLSCCTCDDIYLLLTNRFLKNTYDVVCAINKDCTYGICAVNSFLCTYNDICTVNKDVFFNTYVVSAVNKGFALMVYVLLTVFFVLMMLYMLLTRSSVFYC